MALHVALLYTTAPWWGLGGGRGKAEVTSFVSGARALGLLRSGWVSLLDALTGLLEVSHEGMAAKGQSLKLTLQARLYREATVRRYSWS